VPEEIKQERQARLMALQARISAEKLKEKVGRRIEVLVDAVEGDVAVARAQWDAPEIDGTVRIEDGAGLKPGDLLKVTVTASDAHDLTARRQVRKARFADRLRG
jgi:ribosomal protein S12 methylthiotransferase